MQCHSYMFGSGGQWTVVFETRSFPVLSLTGVLLLYRVCTEGWFRSCCRFTHETWIRPTKLTGTLTFMVTVNHEFSVPTICRVLLVRYGVLLCNTMVLRLSWRQLVVLRSGHEKGRKAKKDVSSSGVDRRVTLKGVLWSHIGIRHKGREHELNRELIH